ncbi:MAG: diaminopimelate epimerase [Acidobacteria bacterium]|nr:diaminopimelate epimerase [Acidobacteriota bacterium]
MRFFKFQALGNDFLIVRESALRAMTDDYGAFAGEICDRHYGAGADGLEIIVERVVAESADFEVRLFNSDGGETPISGNGTRCVGAYLYLVEDWQGPTVRIATGAGVKTLTPVDRTAGRIVFETDMGIPLLRSDQIPVILAESANSVIGQRIDVDGSSVEFTSVSMGNPHCSIFVNDFDEVDWRLLGSKIEHHAAFPDRTNVEFVRIIDRDTIEVRFWERGCGETLASGTGSCGAAIASMLNDLTKRKIRVLTAGGPLLIEWLEDGRVIQTGEAAQVFEGRWSGGKAV